MTMTYQDEWVQGKQLRQGYRSCADRYNTIRAELATLRHPFSVLDLGAHSGYFSFRLAYELGARCTVVDDYPRLRTLVEQNADDRITLVHERLGVKQVMALGSFDVVLALSFLHHQAHWKWMLASIRKMARSRLIVETPSSHEMLRQAAARNELERINDSLQAVGKVIGHSPAVWDKSLRRPMYTIAGKPLVIAGKVFSGSGNCSGFAPRYIDALASVVGYQPIPGSLNVQAAGEVHSLLGPPAIDFQDSTRPGRGRRGGDYQLWPARISTTHAADCHVMVPGVRHHGVDTLEVIAPVNLREHLGLQDGSTVTVVVGA